MAASAVRRITFVATHTFLIDRLPEVLAPTGAAITYIGCPLDPLHRSEFVAASHPVGVHGRCRFVIEALIGRPDLIDDLPDWTIWGSDMDLLRAARSALPEATKLRILPVRDLRGLPIVGSKTGLADLAAELGLPFPRSIVVNDPADLARTAARFRSPFYVKGERGGGSDRLRRIGSPDDMTANPIPEQWYPLLVQETILGEEIAVEAMFANGRLVGWTYSQAVAREDLDGRHTARRFCDPPSLDFASTLDALAHAAGLHGLANCTFIRASGPVRHVLIEADLRPNSWHQFGPRLGVDWGALMFDPAEGQVPMHPEFGRGRGATIRLYPRELAQAAKEANLAAALPWITRAAGTWVGRNHRDRAVNAANRRLIVDLAASTAQARLRNAARVLRWVARIR
jgi:hypothetical protein